jgi:hypothetical protein
VCTTCTRTYAGHLSRSPRALARPNGYRI